MAPICSHEKSTFRQLVDKTAEVRDQGQFYKKSICATNCPVHDHSTTQYFELEIDVVVRWRWCQSKYEFRNEYRFLPRDAMHKRGLCSHAVSVYVCVCLSRSWVVSKRINIYPTVKKFWRYLQNFFNCRVAKPFYFFRAKRHGNIRTGTPP